MVMLLAFASELSGSLFLFKVVGLRGREERGHAPPAET